MVGLLEDVMARAKIQWPITQTFGTSETVSGEPFQRSEWLSTTCAGRERKISRTATNLRRRASYISSAAQNSRYINLVNRNPSPFLIGCLMFGVLRFNSIPVVLHHYSVPLNSICCRPHLIYDTNQDSSISCFSIFGAEPIIAFPLSGQV